MDESSSVVHGRKLAIYSLQHISDSSSIPDRTNSCFPLLKIIVIILIVIVIIVVIILIVVIIVIFVIVVAVVAGSQSWILREVVHSYPKGRRGGREYFSNKRIGNIDRPRFAVAFSHRDKVR